MGLPIFFEPSEPDSASKSAEKTASRARSLIRSSIQRRRHVRSNQPADVRYRERILAHVDEDNYPNLGSIRDPPQYIRPAARPSVTTSTMDSMRELPSSADQPRTWTFTPRPSRSTEPDGPLMPAVPESRDFSRPSIAQSQDSPVSDGGFQREFLAGILPERNILRLRTGTERNAHIARINDRIRASRARAESSSEHEDQINIASATRVRENSIGLRARQRLHRRHRIAQRQLEDIRDLDAAIRREVRGLDDPRQAAQLARPEREEVEGTDTSDTAALQRLERHRRLLVELSVIPSDVQVQELVDQEDLEGPTLQEFDDLLYNIEQSQYDGLGDRERSIDFGDQNSWDAFLVTPDPQSPNPSSLFASTAVSSSQRISLSTPVSSLHETESPTNGDCDPPSDLETEDDYVGGRRRMNAGDFGTAIQSILDGF